MRPAACLILACALMGMGPAAPIATGSPAGALPVTNTDTGQSWHLALEPAARLTSRFFHSYDRQWVTESFRVKGGRLVPIAAAFDEGSYDHRCQRYRARVELDRRGIRLSAIQPRPADRLERIVFRIAHGPSQVLVLEGRGAWRRLPFTGWGSPGQRLVITPRRVVP